MPQFDGTLRNPSTVHPVRRTVAGDPGGQDECQSTEPLCRRGRSRPDSISIVSVGIKRRDESVTTTSRIRYTTDGGVASITIDCPAKKNALNDQGWSDLADALEQATHDPDVRVVQLQGTGGDRRSGMGLEASASQEHPVDRVGRLNQV